LSQAITDRRIERSTNATVYSSCVIFCGEETYIKPSSVSYSDKMPECSLAKEARGLRNVRKN
jgi:hypothetical protein